LGRPKRTHTHKKKKILPITYEAKKKQFWYNFERSDAEDDPGRTGGVEARCCDLGAKRSGIETTKVKKNFEDHDGWTVKNDTITYEDSPNFGIFVFKILSFFFLIFGHFHRPRPTLEKKKKSNLGIFTQNFFKF
jgi:hypothetical protein